MTYSDYSQAADLGNGVAWYAVPGVGTTLLSVITAIVVFVQHPTGQQVAAAVALIVATAGHTGLTEVAASTNSSQRRHAGDQPSLTRLFDWFERLQTARWSLNLAALASAIWLLVATVRAA